MSFKDNLYNARRNPTLMQEIQLTELDRQLNPDQENPQYEIPDGTLPFVFVMECGTMQTTMAINETETLMRRLYPNQALNFDELYLHMADDDYIGRFSNPATTEMSLLIDYNEVIRDAVPFGNQGLRRLIIPSLTEFVVNDELKFTMQYPIYLTVMRHGGVLAEYNNDKPSPISTLSSNVVKWNMAYVTTGEDGSGQNRKLMNMTIPVQQMEVKSWTDTLNPSTMFQNGYTFEDKFFYARVYTSPESDDNWTEINTTHSDLTYDPTKLTAVLKVLNNTLQVSIPGIYVSQGFVIGNIRVDIYTTKGKIDRDLSTYTPNAFKVNFNDIDDNKTMVSPLKHISLVQAMSRNRVDGGADPVTFNKLRDQVVDNTIGASKLPITNVQLKANLELRGYTLVSNIDDISNLQYLATRRLGKPNGLDVVSGAGVAMSQLTIDMESIAASTHVADNGSRITIKPSMLYRFNNGKVTLLADSEINRLLTLGAESRAREVNNARYVYSPFHNVLDASADNFDMRPYYLDNPIIEQKVFIGENDTSNLQAAIDVFNIVKTEKGYQVRVRLISGETFKKLDDEQVLLQIGYQPPNENRYASVNGKLVGLENGERVYTFDIETNYDINASNDIRTTNMSMFSESQNNFFTNLETNLDVSICVINTITPGYQPNELDDMVQRHLLPAMYMVVVRERLQTVLGYDMTRMWRRARPVLGPESYQKWEFNVPAYYEENTYVIDPATGYPQWFPDGSGGLTWHVVNKKGDPVLDSTGAPVYKHLAGDPRYDPSTGKPILIAPRKLMREVNIFMIDGLFYFANEITASTYAKNIPMELVGWLETDIELLNAQLLEEGKLYLYPTTTYGDTVATVREGQELTIPVDQSFTVNFYLTKAAYINPTIRPSLIQNTKITVNEMIQNQTISMSDIIAQLEETSGDEVMALEATGLGGNNNNFTILTVEDGAVRLSIRKKLVVLPNNELTVEDDVTFNFRKHQPRTVN